MEGALSIGLSMGARGLRITVLFLFGHLNVGNLLLLLADLLLLLLADLLLLLLVDLLLQASLIFLNVADLLLQHLTILDEVFELRDGSLHCIKGGLQGVQPVFHLPTRRRVGDYLHGLRYSIKLVTEFGSPVAAFLQRGSQLGALPLIMPLILPEDLVNHVLEPEAPSGSGAQEVGQQAPEAVSSPYQRSQGCRLFTEHHVQPVEPHGYPYGSGLVVPDPDVGHT